ncbi:MAG: DALR domain-containing protein, partial [bacterium]
VSNAQRWLEDKTEVCDRSAADYWERFASAMSDDFNTAQALSVIFEAVSEINRIVGQASVTGNLDNAGELKCHLDVVMKMTAVLGFELKTELSEETSKLLDGLVQKTIIWRAALRERKEFTIADRIRDDLKELGILLEDGPHGTIWRKAEL